MLTTGRYSKSGLLVAGASLFLNACGGGSGGIASTPSPVLSPIPAPSPTPAPSPSPAPQPAPVAFQPTAATIFKAPLYNSELAVMGKGWQYEYTPNAGGAENVRDSDGFAVRYDLISGLYDVTVPVAGTGTLLRTGDYEPYFAQNVSFPADPGNKSATDYCCNALQVTASDRAGSRYSYVSLVDFYAPATVGTNLATIAYGTDAIVQPTRQGEVPLTGTARYSGDAFGHFAGDSTATWLTGTSRFDFDFGKALLTGNVTFGLSCFMGCAYDPVTYTLANTRFNQGATTFSGSLVTPGAPADGSFAGMFAGPGAAEMAAQFQIPFFNGDRHSWMAAGGAIIGKRD